MNKKEKERWNHFVYDILPELKRNYEVKQFPKFIRIIGKHWDFDYYPIGQKCSINFSGKTPNYLILKFNKNQVWGSMSLDVFESKFKVGMGVYI